MKKLIALLLVFVMSLCCLTACGSDTSNTTSSDILEGSESSVDANELDGMKLVDAPTEAYIIACLEATPNVVEIAAVTEDNDPNGELNTDNGYYAAVFFSVDLIDQDDILGDDLIDKGTDAGGCIEAYKTVEDAEARNEYLASYDDNWLFNAGYHTVIGTLVVRISQELDDEQQRLLEEDIIAALTSGEVDEPASTDSSEKNAITVTMSESEFLGMNYTKAEALLRDMGFTVFEYQVVETDDQSKLNDTIEAVEIKSWTFDKGDFEKGNTYETDAIVVFWYYKCEEITPNLTAENNTDLATLLTLRDPCDPSVSTFANKYNGQVIEFDGCVTSMQKHGNYDTRYDMLIGSGDFDENSMRGPNFHLTDVNAFDMDLDTLYLEEVLCVGKNIHIIAEVDDYNSNSSLFELNVISVTVR